MSEQEHEFLRLMHEVARLQDNWLSGVDMTHTSTFERALCVMLTNAGHRLGLLPRFNVTCTWTATERSVEIIPRNGQAARMMRRYKQLYTEDELSRA